MSFWYGTFGCLAIPITRWDNYHKSLLSTGGNKLSGPSGTWLCWHRSTENTFKKSEAENNALLCCNHRISPQQHYSQLQVVQQYRSRNIFHLSMRSYVLLRRNIPMLYFTPCAVAVGLIHSVLFCCSVDPSMLYCCRCPLIYRIFCIVCCTVPVNYYTVHTDPLV